MNKKTKLLNKIVGICIAFIIAFSLSPISALSSLIARSATNVSIPNPSFENVGSVANSASAWESYIKTDIDDNTSVMGGRVSTNPVTWNEEVSSLINTWVTNWKNKNINLLFFRLFKSADESSEIIANDELTYNESQSIVYESNTYTFDSELNTYIFEGSGDEDDFYFEVYDIEVIAENLKQELISKIPACPTNHDFDIDEEDNDTSLLMLFGGYQITVNSENDFSLPDNEIYYYFTQTPNASAISIAEYGFYKASVWVNTYGDAKASFNIDGIELDNYFDSINTNENKSTNYYVYKFYFNDVDTNPVHFLSTVEPETGAKIVYNNKEYTYETFTNATDSTAILAGEESFVKFNEVVVADDDWQQYTIYFSVREATAIKFLLGLGNEDTSSRGYVFFNDLTLEKLTLEEYQTETSSLETNSILGNTNRYFEIKNSFDDTDDLFEFNSAVNGTTLKISDKNEMVIDHFNTGSTSIVSKPITARRLRYARVSIWIKAETSSTAFILTLNADMQGGPSKSQTLSMGTSSVGKWTEYSFFVRGNPFDDTDLTLTINMTKAGVLHVDNLTLDHITIDNYASTSSTNKLALNTNAQKDTITNGHFNNYVSVIEDSTILPVDSWFYIHDAFKYYKKSESNVISKFEHSLVSEYEKEDYIIYDSNKYIWDKIDNCYYFFNGETKLKEKLLFVERQEYVYSTAENGYYNATTNNVIPYIDNIVQTITPGLSEGGVLPTSDVLKNALQISSIDTSDEFLLRSSSITIKASTYNWINFYAATQFGSTAVAYIEDADGHRYASFSINEPWKQYSIYIAGGIADKILYLNIGIDANEGSDKTVYFANVKNTTVSETTVNNKLKQSVSNSVDDGFRIIDLSSFVFAEHSQDIDDNGLYSLYTLSAKAKNENLGTHGVLDTSKDSTYKTLYGEKINSINDFARAYLLQNKADQSIVLSPKVKTNLSGSKYYQVSIFVKTLDIGSNTNFSIRLFSKDGDKTINEYFDKINTSNLGDEDFNGYALYTLLISTGAYSFDDLSFEITLDGEGSVLIGGIETTTIESSDFNSASEKIDNQTKVVDYSSTSAAIEDDKNDEVAEPKQKSNGLMLFFIVFSSILLVGAIVLALIFRGVKKLPKRKKVTGGKKYNPPSDDRGFV